MIVHGTKLEYILYIEGVRVPISSFSVQSASNYGALLRFDILPLGSSLKFLRGMLVHLFKKEGTDEPRLKFFGLLKNVSYVKALGSRSVNIEVGSIDCRWETIAFAEFSDRNIFSSNGTKGLSSADIARLEAEIREVIARAKIGWQAKNLDPALVAAFGAFAVASGNAVASVGSNGGPYLSNSGSLPPEEAKKVAENTEDIKLVRPNTLATVFESAIEGQGGDIIKGLIEMTRQAYRNSTDYNTMEYDRVKLEKALVELDGVPFGTANPLMHIDYKSMLPDTPEPANPEQSMINSQMWAGLASLLQEVVGESKGSATVKTLMLTLLSGVLYRMSVDPTRIEKSIFFHPIMMSFFPPRCNVIFPGEFSTLIHNPQKWSEPTRSIINFPLYAQSKGSYLGAATGENRTVIADPFDPALARILVGFTQPASEETNTKTGTAGSGEAAAKEFDELRARYLKLSRILTEEETAKGVLTNFQAVPNRLLAAMSKVGTLFLADFLHYMSKYSIRVCNVKGELLDEMVVGMPIVVMDGNFSVHGILENFNYSVDKNGGIDSDITIGCPRNLFYEPIPRPPMWLDTEGLTPSKIGKVYMDTFGCDSIYDANLQYPDQKNFTDVLEYSVNHLRYLYEVAQDKRLFVKKYKARRQFTEKEVFMGQHRCTAIEASGIDKSVIMWSGAASDFAPYTVGGYGDWQPPPVDRQKIVLDFLREYYGKPGRVEM